LQNNYRKQKDTGFDCIREKHMHGVFEFDIKRKNSGGRIWFVWFSLGWSGVAVLVSFEGLTASFWKGQIYDASAFVKVSKKHLG
jgi:hypothetical protein